MLYYIIITLIIIPCTLLLPIKKIGKKNMKELKGKNYIISCNHMSSWDPVMLDVTFNKKYRFLAKKELFNTKFKSKCMRSFGAVPVDRGAADTQAIKEIYRHLQNKKKFLYDKQDHLFQRQR